MIAKWLDPWAIALVLKAFLPRHEGFVLGCNIRAQTKVGALLLPKLGPNHGRLGIWLKIAPSMEGLDPHVSAA